MPEDPKSSLNYATPQHGSKLSGTSKYVIELIAWLILYVVCGVILDAVFASIRAGK